MVDVTFALTTINSSLADDAMYKGIYPLGYYTVEK